MGDGELRIENVELTEKHNVLFFSTEQRQRLKSSKMRLHHYYCYTCKVAMLHV